MRKKIGYWLKLKAPLLTVVTVAIFVAIVNIKSGTTLSGWDTLHPEFNLAQYFQRTFFGAWQPHQGLGAPAAQAHLAEIVRLPLIWILMIVPNNLNRYLFFFICYLAGGVGVYYFLTRCWLRQTKFTTWPAAAAAVFYLLNLITLQHFYVPLEMFAVHFGTLPWIFLTMQKAVERSRWQDYFWFFLTMTVAAPAAHTATLFYMYVPFVFIYGLFLLWAKKGKWRAKIKTILILVGLLLAANCYWMIPNIYYTLFHADYVSEAKISQNFSPEAFWNNQAYGWLPQVLTGKNFLFNWNDYDYQTQSFGALFDEWNNYYQTTHLFFLQYVLVAVALIGIYKAWKKQSWQTIAMLTVFLGSLFFLINLNFPTGWLYSLVRSLPLLKEAIRFPFTKFSIVYLFALVVFFANGIVFFQELWMKKWELKSLKSVLISITLIAIILLANGPALTGNFISDKMKVDFPTQYEDLYNFLAFQNLDQVVVKLPLLGYSGWTYNQWEDGGYQGAGWLWFGIPQALLDREFDRWVATNEEVYKQLNLAINKENAQLFANVKNQYNLSLFLLDKSAFTTNNGQEEDYLELEKFLSDNGGEIIWQKDFLSLYQFLPAAELFTAPNEYTLVNQDDVGAMSQDVIYADNGDYLFSTDAGLTYPFAFLTTEESDDSIDWTDYEVIIEGGKINNDNQTIIIPGLEAEEVYTTQVLLSLNGGKLLVQYPHWQITNGQQIIEVPQLTEMEIDVQAIGAERVMIDFNGQITFLAEGESQMTIWQFLPKLEQRIKVVDDRKIVAQENGNKISYLADEQDVFYQSLTNDYLAAVKKETKVTLINSGENLKLRVSRDWETQVNLAAAEEVRNCAAVGEIINLNEDKENILDLQATDLGNACVAVRTVGLNNSSDYLVRFRGQNLAGRSWKVMVIQNNNGERFLETLLPENDFDITYNVMTQSSQKNGELFFNFESNSFGQKARNTLTSLTFVPLDAQRLSGIYIQERNRAKIASVAEVSNGKKNNSANYEVSFVGKSKNNLLVFHQSFDALWRAKIVNEETREKLTLKPQEFNGWTNAWEIPAGEWKVEIYYLPQQWAFWGMGGWVVTVMIFAGKWWIEKRDKKNNQKNLQRVIKTIFE